jgi:hypothetical protein
MSAGVDSTWTTILYYVLCTLFRSFLIFVCILIGHIPVGQTLEDLGILTKKNDINKFIKTYELEWRIYRIALVAAALSWVLPISALSPVDGSMGAGSNIE